MKILLAVTDPDVRASLTELLQSMGGEVEPVECEADVLEILNSKSGTFEVVVAFLLPVVSATDLLTLIKAEKRFRSVPVVVVCKLETMERVVTCDGIFANEDFLPRSIIMALAQIAARLQPPTMH